MPLAVYTVSLGCPKNRVDTETMLACLGPDMTPAPDPARADLVLVNTCGFIEPAVTESLDAILDLAANLAADTQKGRARPLLAVTGCLVSRYGAEALAQEMPEVDLWLSTRELDQWPIRLGAALGRTLPQAPRPRRRLSTGPSFAYLKIAEGCGHACAFCTIPFIRGPLASRPADALVAEARELLDTGVPELVLVAQDSTAYGADLALGAGPGDTPDLRGLPGLLERLLPLPGLVRLRLMYLYPAGLTPALLDFVRDAGPTLVPYFDVPLQHSHPDILRAMGRPFARDPRLVLDRIQSRLPGAAVRTSLMTGFPGETEACFRHLACFVEEARFHHLGVFAYCDEDGAASQNLPDKVDPALAEARRDELMAMQADVSAETMAGYVGQTMAVVVDAPHPEWPGLFVGRTWFQAPEVDGETFVSGPGVVPGAVVQAEIVEAKTYDLVALAVDDSET